MVEDVPECADLDFPLGFKPIGRKMLFAEPCRAGYRLTACRRNVPKCQADPGRGGAAGRWAPYAIGPGDLRGEGLVKGFIKGFSEAFNREDSE